MNVLSEGPAQITTDLGRFEGATGPAQITTDLGRFEGATGPQEERTINVSPQKVERLHDKPSCLPPAREDEAEPAPEPRDDTPTEPITFTGDEPIHTGFTLAVANLLDHIRRTDPDQAERGMERMSISAQDMEELSSWAADMATKLQRTD